MKSRSGGYSTITRAPGLRSVPDANFLGPVIILEPGQKFQVKVKNELHPTGEYADVGPPSPTPADWLSLLNRQHSSTALLHKNDPIGYPIYGTGTEKTPLSEFYIDEPNIPKNYNFTNLHFHGLQITPHLFDPIGTLDSASDYITIKPGEECTYTFALPDDHPTGTFWYHPHRTTG